MGKLSKQVFRQFVEFECDRQLFWLVGREDRRWMTRPESPVPRDERRARPEMAAALGKAYEQRVYRFLLRMEGTEADADPRGEVVESSLDPDLLEELHDEHMAGERPRTFALLEHQWETPGGFLRSIFGLEEGDAIPVKQWSGTMRPDILMFTRDESLKGELCPDGRVEVRREGDARVALQIIDIKHTSEQGVGKRQFVELIFYAHALSAWLHQEGLDDRFFVPVVGHGIMPQRDATRLIISSADELLAQCVPLVWEESAHIFEHTCAQLRRLWSQAPHHTATVAVNIQPACGRCDFLEDCKRSLGMPEEDTDVTVESAGGWDLRLMPYTSRSISEQLRARGFRTVGDVVAGLHTVELGETPEPLYPERPLLSLKAQALMHGDAVFPERDGAVEQRHLSIAIPNHSDIALVFDVESDPTNDVVFGVAFDLNISTSPGGALAPLHNVWWEAWRAALESGEAPGDLDVGPMEALLNWDALRDAADKKVREDELRRRVRQSVDGFWRSLYALHRNFGGVTIALPGEEFRGFSPRAALVAFQYAYVNMGLEPNHEEMLASRTVTALFHILRMCNAVETLMLVSGEYGPMGLSFGGFYWSMEQLQNIQDMLERHLPFLVGDDAVRSQFGALIGWLTPSDSGVAHFHQHKKVFNLRTFVETSVGLPHVINYTWHEMATEHYGFHFHRRFWPRHFNYMDFSVWHDYLQEADTAARSERVMAILRELKLKVGYIGRLRRRYQQQARQRAMLTQARPISAEALRRGLPDTRYHPLARFWALYSKLSATVGELEAEAARSNYPAWSIGKLSAGEASNLEVHSGDQMEGDFTFTLCGLSANMSLGEGDYVYLLPESARDARVDALTAWQVIIEEMKWDAAQRGYAVRASFRGRDVHPWFSMTPARQRDEVWFVYPRAGDIWPGYLYANKDSFLSRESLGVSWLGHRLAYLWGIGASRHVSLPPSLSFGSPEVTIYAPDKLPQRAPRPMPLPTLFPAPDPSQQQAIEMALGATVSCIQGPPGTGKSQTIAALVEAFLRDRGRPARILVTATSYAAMRVVLGKLRHSRLADGQPGLAATAPMVFLRSARRDPIPKEPGLPDVHDLVIARNAFLDGQQIKQKRRGGLLEDHLGDHFILFANAWSLYKLGARNGARNSAYRYKFLHDDFGFDLIIVDEASQMPADQFLAAAALVHKTPLTLAFHRPPKGDKVRSATQLKRMKLTDLPEDARLTQVVIVGDHNQLPPVQPVKPPQKLQAFLGSLFNYFVEGHQVPSHQLRVNYRSRQTIVSYTDRLALYERLTAFREQAPYAPLPPPPAGAQDWIRHVLDDAQVVGALIHSQRFETAVSPLEAELTVMLVEAFFQQMGVDSPESEHIFWQEHLGIVAPHNAQGRLITRRIFDRLTGQGVARTHLDGEALMGALRNTIYSVEKFQGSDRTFIIGSVGVSSRDQLASEEEFIYDLNRFNVLTSRAKQKMLLICSRNYLDYIPRDRDVMGYAARVRDFALNYCHDAQPFVLDHSEWRRVSIERRTRRPDTDG